jgi:hypothetical protein
MAKRRAPAPKESVRAADMATKEVVGPMKLTVPAIRAAEPNARRQQVSEQTGVLLDAIDTLLAELATVRSYEAKRGPRLGVRGTHEHTDRVLAGSRDGRPAGRGASPVPPAAA